MINELADNSRVHVVQEGIHPSEQIFQELGAGLGPCRLVVANSKAIAKTCEGSHFSLKGSRFVDAHARGLSQLVGARSFVRVQDSLYSLKGIPHVFDCFSSQGGVRTQKLHSSCFHQVIKQVVTSCRQSVLKLLIQNWCCNPLDAPVVFELVRNSVASKNSIDLASEFVLPFGAIKAEVMVTEVLVVAELIRLADVGMNELNEVERA